MKPIVVSHASYQNFVMDQLRKHYGGGALTLVNRDWPLITKFWITDLSGVTRFLQDDYDWKGPAPRDPAAMLRSYLIYLHTQPTKGLTEWVDMLYRIPLYAILSGFEPQDVPGIGTFYDFFRRLWGSDRLNVKPRKSKRRRRKPKKGKKKGEKAPTTTSGKIKRLIQWAMRHADHQTQLPTDRLFDLFQSEFLTVSANLGLLGDPNTLSVAGDGTPVLTSAYPRSKPSCDCRAQGISNCEHPRIYSQPDCNIGWDSSRERFFNGYHAYMLMAANSRYDLPLYPKLQPASRHDAVGFVLSLLEFSQRFTLGTVNKMLLDAAHDAEAIYMWLNHQNIEAFIDLNPRTKRAVETGSDITISPEGIPVCREGHNMKSNGYDQSQNRQKWRCPLAKGTKNACPNPCSTAKYGRTFHTHSEDNLRLFPKTARGSEAWEQNYKRRTAVERSNKREKIDYHYEAGRHRSTAMWSIRLYAIMMCQHIDAWYDHQKESFYGLKALIFPATA